MIAAAATTSSVSLDRFPVGWFDIALIVVLVFGYFRGRKNGMTKEVLPMFQWLATVLLCGLGYELVGQGLLDVAQLKVTPAYILGYLSLAFFVYVVFVLVKKALLPRLIGSNFFGNNEYHFGKASGVLRYFCILFFALALLHAPFYTSAEIAAHQAYNARWYGGGQQGYNGDFIPTIQGVQESVFYHSFTGSLIAKYLNVMLISTEAVKPVKPAGPTPMIHIGN